MNQAVGHAPDNGAQILAAKSLLTVDETDDSAHLVVASSPDGRQGMVMTECCQNRGTPARPAVLLAVTSFG